MTKPVLKEIKDLHKQKSQHGHELIIGKMEYSSSWSAPSLSKSQVAFFQKSTNWP